MMVPQTGALAGFGEATSVVIRALQPTLRNGVDLGGRSHPVELVVRDTSSDLTRSLQVAGDLIEHGKLDLLMSFAAPSPVADTWGIPGSASPAASPVRATPSSTTTISTT